MNTENLKNWLKTQDPEFEGRIQLGGVNGNTPEFLGVYPGTASDSQHIALGGPACTSYGAMAARLLLRWGKSQTAAEAKAQALWRLFYGLTNADMDGVSVACVDPGKAPVPIGKGVDGVFEYVINLNITYNKE